AHLTRVAKQRKESVGDQIRGRTVPGREEKGQICDDFALRESLLTRSRSCEGGHESPTTVSASSIDDRLQRLDARLHRIAGFKRTCRPLELQHQPIDGLLEE